MIKALNEIKALSTEKIIEIFEATETNNSEEIPTVRGWLMDILEERNPAAFDAWVDSLADSPREFYK